jgi:hypothetical protein
LRGTLDHGGEDARLRPYGDRLANNEKEGPVPIADFSFADAVLAMTVFFVLLLFLLLLVIVFEDLFTRHDIGGGMKAAWTLFVLIVPFLGILLYIVLGRNKDEQPSSPPGTTPKT